MTATIEETADAADDNAIWPVDLPPPLDDPGADEEISRLRTLEERIKHKYTPSKLAVDVILQVGGRLISKRLQVCYIHSHR